ncbi:MAG TPA: hypothetical protein VJ846_04825 [Sphingomicrobium sp.]|nr:hypothetical protein [Sphingomicrobium sp.]
MTRSASVLLLAVLSSSACHISKNSADAGENVSVKASDNGSVSFNLPFAKGEVQIPRGTFENGQLDIDGVKMIPGGTVHGFSMDARDKGATVHLAFTAPKSPQEVSGYFLEQFKQHGDAATQSGNEISGKTKNGDALSIHVEPAAQGSVGTIVIQSKD